MTATMKAVVLDEPGPVTNLHLRYLPVPEPAGGWVRIKVEAFGLNRSELHTRLGLAEGVTFPRVPGGEAAGRADADPDRLLQTGQQVAAMMGGMGRTFDGGYAEYTAVPRSQVIPFTSGLPREILGAIPETLQTAYGSLTTGLDLKPGQTLLIRGGTSALGLAATTLAKDMGATVLATTRNPQRTQDLAAHGVDHPLVDDGTVAGQVRKIIPEGVHAALELVGTRLGPCSMPTWRSSARTRRQRPLPPTGAGGMRRAGRARPQTPIHAPSSGPIPSAALRAASNQAPVSCRSLASTLPEARSTTARPSVPDVLSGRRLLRAGC